MLFIIESIILCVLFSIGILVPLAKNPIGKIMSFPVEIIRRVESLPQNVLRVKVGVETQPLKYLGFIIIDYSFEDGEFKADKIVHDPCLAPSTCGNFCFILWQGIL